MKYTEKGDTVTLEMSRADYGNLLLSIGIAAGTASDKKAFWGWMQFVNELNTGNPQFRPYEIPEEFKVAHPAGGKA
jgi:hypothetical protein